MSFLGFFNSRRSSAGEEGNENGRQGSRASVTVPEERNSSIEGGASVSSITLGNEWDEGPDTSPHKSLVNAQFRAFLDEFVEEEERKEGMMQLPDTTKWKLLEGSRHITPAEHSPLDGEEGVYLFAPGEKEGQENQVTEGGGSGGSGGTITKFESPKVAVDLLKVDPSTRLLSHLRLTLTTCAKSWLIEFIDVGGLSELVEVVASCKKEAKRVVYKQTMLLEALRCVKVTMQISRGMEAVIAYSGCISSLAECVDSTFAIPARKQVLELLTAVCVYSDKGHIVALEAMDHLRDLYRERDRFQGIVALLGEEDKEMKVSCMVFLNAMVNVPRDINTRMQLRQELVDLNINGLLSRLKNYPSASLKEQLKLFEDKANEDTENVTYAGIRLSNPMDICFALTNRFEDSTAAYKTFLSVLQHMLLVPNEILGHKTLQVIERAAHEAVLVDSGTTAVEQNCSFEYDEMKSLLENQRILSPHADIERHLDNMKRRISGIPPIPPPSSASSTSNPPLSHQDSVSGGLSFGRLSSVESLTYSEEPKHSSSDSAPPSSKTPTSDTKKPPRRSLYATNELAESLMDLDRDIHNDDLAGISLEEHDADDASAQPQSTSLSRKSSTLSEKDDSTDVSIKKHVDTISIEFVELLLFLESAREKQEIPGISDEAMDSLHERVEGLSIELENICMKSQGIEVPSAPDNDKSTLSKVAADAAKAARSRAGSVPPPAPPPPPGAGGATKGTTASGAPPPGAGAPATPGKKPPTPPPPPPPGYLTAGLGKFDKPSPKTPSKYRQLFWTKLTEGDVAESLWTDSLTPRIDISEKELEELFKKASKRSTTTVEVPEVVKRATTIHILDQKRSHRINILLAQFPQSAKEIREAVLDLNESILTSEHIVAIRKCLPSSTELDILMSYDGPVGLLGRAEQLYVELLSIPRLDEKLAMFESKLKLKAEMEVQWVLLGEFSKACDEVQVSTRLSKLLKLILRVGNILNQGTHRGDAPGFQVDFLSKVSATKAVDRKTTLVDYLAEKLDTQHRTLLSVREDLPHIGAAKALDIEELKSQTTRQFGNLGGILSEVLTNVRHSGDSNLVSTIQALVKAFPMARLSDIRQGIETLDKLVNSQRIRAGDRFHDNLLEFICSAATELLRFAEELKFVVSRFDEVRQHFGVKRFKTGSKDFFGHIDTFINQISAAWVKVTENRHKHTSQMRKVTRRKTGLVDSIVSSIKKGSSDILKNNSPGTPPSKLGFKKTRQGWKKTTGEEEHLALDYYDASVLDKATPPSSPLPEEGTPPTFRQMTSPLGPNGASPPPAPPPIPKLPPPSPIAVASHTTPSNSPKSRNHAMSEALYASPTAKAPSLSPLKSHSKESTQSYESGGGGKFKSKAKALFGCASKSSHDDLFVDSSGDESDLFAGSSKRSPSMEAPPPPLSSASAATPPQALGAGSFSKSSHQQGGGGKSLFSDEGTSSGEDSYSSPFFKRLSREYPREDPPVSPAKSNAKKGDGGGTKGGWPSVAEKRLSFEKR